MGAGGANPIIDGFVKNDKVPWYRKKNLRSLYVWLVPFAMFIESTSGFDSSMMNVRLSPNFQSWRDYYEAESFRRSCAAEAS